MDTNNWRNDDSRQKIVNKIMDTLRRHMPQRGPDGMNELSKIALRFEDKIYTQAASQKDYLQRISLKMLSLESKAIQTSFPGSSPGNSQRPLDSGGMMPAQIRNQPASGNSLPLPGQPQPQQPLLQQTLQNSISASGIPSSAGLAPPLSSIPMPGISHNSINSSTGQVLPSLLASSQRQLPSRQQQHQQQVVQQHQQSPSQQHQLLYQQHQLQVQHQQAFLKQKLQQQSQIQPSILQQQQLALPQSQPQPSQQSTLQTAQQPGLQSTQQYLLQQSQPSLVQPAQQSGLQQAQQSTVQQASQSALQQNQQSVLRQQQSQQSVMQQQQQASMFQQSILPPQQQHQQLLVQQNNVSNMQQQQNQFQQLLQPKHQQTQQTSSSLLQSQSKQLQQQSQQQQHLSQLQSQSQPLQQQQPLLQQSNPAQQELQQRLQTNSGFLQQQQQSSIEPQKQLLQQRGLSEASSTSMESTVQTGQSTVADWQEKVFQRLQNLKEMYYPEIKELFTKLSLKCQQPMQHEQSEKLKHYRQNLQRMMQYLQVSKNNIPPGFKEDKVDAFEKQIQAILNSFKQRKSAPQQQQGQQQLANQSASQVQSMQQQPQTKLSQMQQQEKHINQLQQMNLQPSVTSMQSNNVAPIQHGSMSLQQSGVQTSQQNVRTTMQSAANLSSMQGTSVATLQQSSVNHLQNNNIASLQQNISPFQQNSISSMQQTGINTLQQNNINTLQHHHHALTQQEIIQVKMQQQRNIQQQQQLQQRQQQIQQKQQQAVQLQVECHAQQMPQLQQINDLNNDSRTKQSSIKQASMLQHHQLSQRSLYQQQQQQQQQQQLKTGSMLSVSSPQLLQAASPQISQHSSPQIEQKSLVVSSLLVPKVGTPVQPETSPFMAPSPSTLPLPSPHIEDAEKQSFSISPIPNAGNAQGFQQPTPVRNHAQSLAIGTPGISTSPLLADISLSPAQNTVNQDGHQTVSSGPLMEDKSSTSEPPLEQLVKVINSISPKALSSAVNDICSVVNLIDRMAGSAPGDGSRAAAGEDLVAMTKCRLQARNLMSQDGSAATKRMKRCMSSMPLSTAASGGNVTNSLQQHNNVESPEMESTATSNIKRPRLAMKHALQNEIREINHQLMDTVVDVSEDGNDVAAAAAEGTDGIVLKCSYNAIALSPRMKSRYRSSQMTPISPLRLLIPENYPNSSPILLDRAPVEPRKKYEDLSSRAKANFHAAVRALPQPMSLKVLAKSWDVCARSAVAEYAQQCGGGSFSSRFCAWESCANA